MRMTAFLRERAAVARRKDHRHIGQAPPEVFRKRDIAHAKHHYTEKTVSKASASAPSRGGASSTTSIKS